ncbi:hypothetical protein [Ammoniphilus sp. YIM 78166]|uniref:hypothetical protein n=1 Tax=Ammoniphilus sp. YIM 78166 TaxID=1644106 RepID=UPI00142F9332|nr:hypothetical protein [Ammoniphilus sp. YIM 78166]
MVVSDGSISHVIGIAFANVIFNPVMNVIMRKTMTDQLAIGRAKQEDVLVGEAFFLYRFEPADISICD